MNEIPRVDDLQRRREYEALLLDISEKAAEAEERNALFESCVALLGERIGVSRAYAFEYDERADTMDNTQEWCAQGVTPQKDHLQGVPGDALTWWLDTLRRREVICYSDIEEIPDNATKELLRPQAILSLLVVPLFVNKKLWGFFGFDDCARHRNWRGEDVDILLSVSRILSAVVERELAEEQRKKSEERFRVAQEMSPDGFTILRPVRDGQGGVIDFTWVYENEAIAKLNGTDPQAVVGERLLELFPGHRGTKFLKVYKQVAESGEPQVFEDGYADETMAKAAWFRIVVVPMGGDIAILAQDITERKRAEEEVLVANQQLRATEQQLRASNQQLEAMNQQLRATEQALRQFEWLDQKEQVELEGAEDPYTPPYGDVTELNTCRVIRDAVGADTLRSMARDLMDLLDTSVAVYEANGDYAFGVFDSGWCRLLDSASFRRCGTKDTGEALRCGEWLCHENCWNDSAKTAMRSGAPADLECVGGIRLYAVPIEAGGECVGAVNIGYGTPPKDEASLCELAHRFELSKDQLQAAAEAYKPRPRFIVDVAKRRCRTLARMMGDAVEKARLEAQLAQADRLSSMGTLAAGVAHEINNPLTYTLYNLETVVEDLPGLLADYRHMQAALGHDHPALVDGKGLGIHDVEELLERGKEALEGAQRIRGITRSLGTFARVDDDEVEPVDVRRSVEHASNMARNEIKYRAKLLLELPPTPAVLGYPGKLAQVFLNLLINAAHAIEEGDIQGNSIRVRSRHEGDQVVVEVSDTGKGISDEHFGRLFDPFFTTKAVGQGSGLGLSISKKIVTELGGEITCESEVGEGTTFCVRLPVIPQDWGGEEANADAAEQAAPAGDKIRGRILAVDDEAGIRALIDRMLDQDHEVVTAASGREGKALLEQDQAFDLIILDLMMPEISGMDLHRWLVEHHPALADRVVFFTGGVFTPKARAYLSKVDNMRLEKPLNIATFKNLVEKLVFKETGTK